MKQFYQIYKYELLLFGLFQHLFIGLFLSDLEFYKSVIWPINMFLLGITSIGMFSEKGQYKNILQKVLFALVFALPIGLSFYGNSKNYYLFLNLTYVFYFCFLLYELLCFLLKSSYINKDIIIAAGCGYLLLIETSTFLFQYYFTQNPTSFSGIDLGGNASIYMDFVYFSSITLTSIGYGDISPATHFTKLAVSIFGLAGQFYTVVLVGILISKFSNTQNK